MAGDDQVDDPTRASVEGGSSGKFDEERKGTFLRLLSETGVIVHSAHGAGVCKQTVYAHRESDKAFAAGWDEALEAYADTLEKEAYRRAVKGWDEPVYQQGAEVGVVRKYSDPLLQTLLKGNRPEKYRERMSADLTVAGILQHAHRVDFSKLTDLELAEAEALLLKARADGSAG